MARATEHQYEWVSRVFGLRLAQGGGDAELPYMPIAKRCEARWNRALRDAYKASKPMYAEVDAQSPGHAAGLDSIIQSYWSDLLGPIAQVKRGKDDPTAIEPLLRTVKDLRAEMQSDPWLAELQSAGAPVGRGFLQALDEIETLLKPVVRT